MAVQVWIGEKPENPNERKAIIALANGLERLEGLYVMLANFSVGGHTIDLVIIKNDAIFILEMKHCDGVVFGSVNGRWKVVGPNGAVKWLNQGRKNPYNQVIAYYYALRNFLHNNRLEFLSDQKASQIDFRACKRVIVISPTLEPESEINLDWRVAVRGLDELPTYLVTERTDEIVLTDSEVLAIPKLLNCEPWPEVNKLVAGVMPTWEETPSEPPPLPEEPPPSVTPSPPPSWRDQYQRATSRSTLLVMGWMTVLVLLAVLWFQRPMVTQVVGSGLTPSPLATVPPFPIPTFQANCQATLSQTVHKRRDSNHLWRTITEQPLADPYVAVTLEGIEFCPGRIVVHWSVTNHTENIVQMGLNRFNISVRDTAGTDYQLQTAPAIRVLKGQTGFGSATIERPISPNATALTIELNNEPFGPQIYTVQVPAP